MVSSQAMKDTGRSRLGMETRRPPMVSKARAPMDRLKEGIVMDSKDPTEARVAAVVEAMAARCREVVEAVEAAVLVMEDGMTAKVVRVRGMDAMVTVQKEGASEAGAVVALNAADTTAVEEVDLLVWEVVTVVATKITVDLEITAPGMNQLVSRITRTTTPFLYRDWGRMRQFRRLQTSSNKLESSRLTKKVACP